MTWYNALGVFGVGVAIDIMWGWWTKAVTRGHRWKAAVIGGSLGLLPTLVVVRAVEDPVMLGPYVAGLALGSFLAAGKTE